MPAPGHRTNPLPRECAARSARKLLDVAAPAPEPEDIAADPATPVKPCPCCGSAMRIIEVFKAGGPPQHRPTAMPAAIRIDTS
jgi:hypothetical protein